MHLPCTKSNQCDEKEVCDRKTRVCRESHRVQAHNKAELAKECLRKGIPINYERGPKVGQRKNRHSLEYCKYQKDRTGHRGPVLALPAPYVKPASPIPEPPRVQKTKTPVPTKAHQTRSKTVAAKKPVQKAVLVERPAPRMMTRAAARRAQ